VKLTGNRCQCPACGECFNSVFGFDRHRVGGWDNRRCLSIAAMLDKGFSRASSGFWITATRNSNPARGADRQGANG
jgi:hypothetical protein